MPREKINKQKIKTRKENKQKAKRGRPPKKKQKTIMEVITEQLKRVQQWINNKGAK